MCKKIYHQQWTIIPPIKGCVISVKSNQQVVIKIKRDQTSLVKITNKYRVKHPVFLNKLLLIINSEFQKPKELHDLYISITKIVNKDIFLGSEH